MQLKKGPPGGAAEGERIDLEGIRSVGVHQLADGLDDVLLFKTGEFLGQPFFSVTKARPGGTGKAEHLKDRNIST